MLVRLTGILIAEVLIGWREIKGSKLDVLENCLGA